ncbi:hypothetical protein SZ55_2554 [Pseudomonas sp. FeS53a]|nr:hypothetical protein SZ55_2554 [Pseudomonas sp. FeS53a]
MEGCTHRKAPVRMTAPRSSRGCQARGRDYTQPPGVRPALPDGTVQRPEIAYNVYRHKDNPGNGPAQ